MTKNRYSNLGESRIVSRKTDLNGAKAETIGWSPIIAGASFNQQFGEANDSRAFVVNNVGFLVDLLRGGNTHTGVSHFTTIDELFCKY